MQIPSSTFSHTFKIDKIAKNPINDWGSIKMPLSRLDGVLTFTFFSYLKWKHKREENLLKIE